MKIIITIALVLSIAHQAIAQQYLVMPDMAAAQARSAAQYRALCRAPCDALKNVTQYVWPVVPLTDGTAALVIMPEGDAAASRVLPNGASGGLSIGEQKQLQTKEQIGDLLPQLDRTTP